MEKERPPDTADDPKETQKDRELKRLATLLALIFSSVSIVNGILDAIERVMRIVNQIK